MTPDECACIYANRRNTAAVNDGLEMGGYLIHECESCKKRRETALAQSRAQDSGGESIIEAWERRASGFRSSEYGCGKQDGIKECDTRLLLALETDEEAPATGEGE
jgi:hypothetical protein